LVSVFLDKLNNSFLFNIVEHEQLLTFDEVILLSIKEDCSIAI